MQCVTWLYTKIVCLVYAIVVLVISIKIHLLNTKLASLTYSIDHKVKIFKDCPTECYRYCVFVCQWLHTSLTTWVSVPIHAPDCACRSLALAHPSYFYTNWFFNLNLLYQDIKSKIIPYRGNTECYRYHILMEPHAWRSHTKWLSVSIHAPDCVCRSFYLGCCLDLE